MGSGEENTPAKPAKPAVATQELPTTPSYPDWASPMQAYYGAGASTPPFFPSTVASSPPPHPYLWSGQHLMPPYGTPLPYPAMYPHGGIYGHPPMSAAQGTIVTATETEGKSLEAKDKGGSVKKSKGSSGNTGLASGKSGDGGKTASGSANDGASQSGESGSEGSSDASDENNNHQEFSAARKKSFDQMIADGANAQHNNAAYYSSSSLEPSFSARGQPAAKLPITVPGKPAVTVPTTNLNIGMDLWNSSAPVGSVPIKARPNAAGVSPAVVPAAMVGREGVMPEPQWQDEREMKRQKRKQSNRESARRSRLRKQAECEELGAKVETLSNENRNLRNELQRLSQECEKLTSENASIMEQLTRLYGHDAISSVEVNDTNTSGFQSADEGNGHMHESSRGSKAGSAAPNGKFFTSNGKHESGSN